MSNDKLILSIGFIVGILLFKNTKPNLLKGILIGLIISFGISFFDNKALVNISYLSFGVFSLIFGIYSGINKKWLHLIIGLFVFISFLFKMMHFPFSNEVKLLMLIPIIAYIISLIKLKSYKNGLSISTIFVAYLLTEFIVLLE